jgi:hypothetical protein
MIARILGIIAVLFPIILIGWFFWYKLRKRERRDLLEEKLVEEKLSKEKRK